MRRLLALVAGASLALAAIGVAEHAMSAAPKDQYDIFSPDSSTIVDEQTRLEWRRETTADVDFNSAEAACAQDAGPGFRLPTLRELLTLVDEQPHRIYVDAQELNRQIDPNAFPDTRIDEGYWSSTPAINGHFTVNFRNGTTDTGGANDKRHARCVRSF
jgi:hypothetical protein